MHASATASARRASTPVTEGLRFADRRGELDELAGVRVAHQLGVAADRVGARAGGGGTGRAPLRAPLPAVTIPLEPGRPQQYVGLHVMEKFASATARAPLSKVITTTAVSGQAGVLEVRGH